MRFHQRNGGKRKIGLRRGKKGGKTGKSPAFRWERGLFPALLLQGGLIGGAAVQDLAGPHDIAVVQGDGVAEEGGIL